jgi:hypothetical protein
MSPSPSFSPTVSVEIDGRAVSSSEAAALHGCVRAFWSLNACGTQAMRSHKAKTPMVAGIISGGAVALAWAIAFAMFLYKRHKGRKRARREGLKSHRDLEVKDLPHPEVKYIIPPDPAIIGGMRAPGDRAATAATVPVPAQAGLSPEMKMKVVDKGKARATVPAVPGRAAEAEAERENAQYDGSLEGISSTGSSSEARATSSTMKLPTRSDPI